MPEDNDPTMPDIMVRLFRSIGRHDLSSARMRFAVTEEEYRQIREFCLATQGRFLARIGNIPLIIEDFPDHLSMRIEYRTGQSVKSSVTELEQTG